MSTQDISLLGFALLGLIQQKSLSGYDLRKIFASTAMATFSDSPGAIYPALQRLEERGLIRGVVEDGSGLRRRRLFHLTPPGKAQLKAWLRKPVTRDEVARRSHEVLLRFVFTDRVLGSKAAVALLQALQKELTAYIPTLKLHVRRQADVMPLSGILALVSGIKQNESLLRWTREAIATYEKRELASLKEKAATKPKSPRTRGASRS
jgi:DNA-binding PadR family transcriptional regulator